MSNQYQDRAQGMLVGLAVGDALGAPVEFGYSSDMIRQLGDKIAHFVDSPRAPAGVWTDDTEMALCLADSLLERRGYDSYDIMRKFVAWKEEGYRTFYHEPAFDVGAQTRHAIDEFKDYPVVCASERRGEAAGNGAMMRLAPVIIANISADNLLLTIKMAVLSGCETHNSIAAETTTAVFATMLHDAVQGWPKDKIVKFCARGLKNAEYQQFWRENSEAILGRAREKTDSLLRDLGGYVVDTLAIALWGLLNYDNFYDGMLAVIRLGGDTDTNAACYGQLAGAYYGYSAIPDEWRKQVYLAEELVEIANKLLALPECPILRTRFEDDQKFEEPEQEEA